MRRFLIVVDSLLNAGAGDERFPASVQPFVQALPLTALDDALRGVMLEGVGLPPVLPELANLAVWGGISFLLALKLFRWH